MVYKIYLVKLDFTKLESIARFTCVFTGDVSRDISRGIQHTS